MASPTSLVKSSDNIQDIEEIHRIACATGSNTYIDPISGFTCFTQLAHLKRGVCCGSQCRHCPYGWENVRPTVRSSSSSSSSLVKIPSVQLKSGDKEAAQKLLQHFQTTVWAPIPLETPPSSNTENMTSPSTTHGIPKKTGGRYGGTYTSKNVPYTRGGDMGNSSLLTGERRSKVDAAFEAMGTVDELCSVIGVCHAEWMELESSNHNENPMNHWMLDIMSRLFDIGSHVAKPPKVLGEFHPDGIGGGFDAAHVTELEHWIDVMTEQLPELTSFLLPTGSRSAAHYHVARTVCRRTERGLVPLVTLGVCDPNALAYMNRLSDFLFTAARFVNHLQGKEEILYRRPTRSATQRDRVTLSSSIDRTSDTTTTSSR